MKVKPEYASGLTQSRPLHLRQLLDASSQRRDVNSLADVAGDHCVQVLRAFIDIFCGEAGKQRLLSFVRTIEQGEKHPIRILNDMTGPILQQHLRSGVLQRVGHDLSHHACSIPSSTPRR